MKKIVLCLLLMVGSLYAQKKDIIYRIAYDSYPAVGYSYNINVLILEEDSRYYLINQKFSSRKMARKNIPLRTSKEYGNWTIIKDTLKLIEDQNKRESRYIILSDKKITFLFDNVDQSKYYWRKIKN
ncbi:hypothetical protein L0669_02715 [Flavobacterium bizetiae]|uniref:hypothetical protein n=1 Tax=Flavobacterium bizetiae TaxID=2704140 RepID=UPI0021E6DBCB|nr:hypothetical protein [Flavobacterium bizetiae]UTN04818.1 hypothetical protein L0669_02715 [Flavobacterium bizetiae]